MGLERVLNRLESNENTFHTLSKQYGQDALTLSENERKAQLESLTEFSTTLSEHFSREKVEENKRLAEEGRMLEIEEEMRKQEEEGDPGISAEEKIDHYAGVELLKENKLAFDSAGLTVQENGGSFQESEEVKNLSGWKLYGYTKQKAISAGDNYKAWMEGAMANNNDIQISYGGRDFTPSQAQSLKEKSVAMGVLRRQYLKEQGLLGINHVLLSEHFYDKALKSHGEIMAEFQKQDAIERSFLSEEEAYRDFRADKDFGSLVSSLAPLRDKNNKIINRRGALDKGVQIVKDLMDVNLFDQEDYEDLGNQTVKIDGKEVGLVKDWWKTRYGELGNHLIDAQNKNLERSEDDKKNNFKKAEAIILDEIIKSPPEKLTPEFLLEKKLELESKHIGFRSTKLDNYITRAMPDAKSLQRQRLEVQKLVKYGLLTKEKLNEFDLRLYQDYINIATTISKGRDTTTKYLGYVKDMVEFSAKFSPSGAAHHSVAQMTDIFKAKYRQYYADAIAAKSETPELDAWNQVRTEFGDGEQWKHPIGAANGLAGTYKIPYEQSKEVTVNRKEEINTEILRQNDLLRKHGAGAVAIPGAFISKEALADNLKTFGTIGWSPPGVVARLKKHFPEKSELEIIEALASANGVKINLPDSPAINFIQENTTTEGKQVVSHGGQNGSARVIGSATQNNGGINEIFSTDKEAIDEISSTYGIGSENASAAYELVNNHPHLAKAYGITPSASGEVDWDRVGLAALHIQNQTMEGFEMGVEAYKQLMERLKQFGIDAKEEWGPLIEDHIKYKGLKSNIELGKQLTDAAPGEFYGDLIVDGLTDLSKWGSDQLNNIVNQILGSSPPPLTGDEIQELNVISWKHSGNPLYLKKIYRNGVNGK